MAGKRKRGEKISISSPDQINTSDTIFKFFNFLLILKQRKPATEQKTTTLLLEEYVHYSNF
jgi:hypothetical protein